MTIYIESFIIQNLLVNMCVLRLIRLSTKYITTQFRVIIGSLIGAIILVFSSIFISNNVLLSSIKFICTLLMILFVFRTNKKQFFTSCILYFLFSFALYGGIIALTSTRYTTSFGSVISSKFNINWIIVVLIVLTYIYELVLNTMKKRTFNNSNIITTTLTNKNVTIKINAYLDTGNTLSVDGQSVIIVDQKSFLDLTDLSMLTERACTSVAVSTVSGNINMRVYKIDKAKLNYNKKTTEIICPYIAVSEQKLGNNFSALLNPNLLKN